MFRTTCLVGLLCVSAPAAFAQTQRGQGRAAEVAGPIAAPEQPGPNLRVQRDVVRMLDDWAVQQAHRALQLDPPTSTQFAPRLRKLHEVRRRNQMARNRLLQELRRLAGPRAPGQIDEAQIAERLGALREHDEQAAAELRAAYDAVDEVLNPRQQARFRIFEENLESRKLDLLLQARERAGRGGVER